MKQSKFQQAFFACLFFVGVFFISCNGNDAKKPTEPKTDSVTKAAPTVKDTVKPAPNTGTIDTTKTEQNPPAVRHPN
ncbi:MAG: hypothetical protein JST23_08175 [Bacteroidetes bacterium]|nr:hypothetical protein [Bacteroidota bacterium]